MNAPEALAFVAQHGVVLVSAKGPVPKLVDAIAGETIKGSWWGHAKGKEIFSVLQQVGDSDDILTCRLVGAKVTLVHRRLWPALVAAASHFPAANLCQVIEEHTPSGRHVAHDIAFPDWVPKDVAKSAARLSLNDALKALGAWTGE
ncbi:MAG: hypothetical protein V4463_11080 [Pseudomonadota bacterium]